MAARNRRASKICARIAIASTVLVPWAAACGANHEYSVVSYNGFPSPDLYCGVDCLYVMCRSNDEFTASLSELEARCLVSRDGVSAENLIEAAKHFGVDLVGATMTMGDLVGWNLPSLLHVDDGHYIVFISYDDDRMKLFDPSIGTIECSRREFDSRYRWEGVALIETGKRSSVRKLFESQNVFLAGLLGLVAWIATIVVSSFRRRNATSMASGSAR